MDDAASPDPRAKVIAEALYALDITPQTPDVCAVRGAILGALKRGLVPEAGCPLLEIAGAVWGLYRAGARPLLLVLARARGLHSPGTDHDVACILAEELLDETMQPHRDYLAAGNLPEPFLDEDEGQ